MPQLLYQLPRGGSLLVTASYDEEGVQALEAINQSLPGGIPIPSGPQAGAQPPGAPPPGAPPGQTQGALRRPSPGIQQAQVQQGRAPAPFSRPSPGPPPSQGGMPGGQPPLTPGSPGLMAGGQPTRRRPSMNAPGGMNVQRPGLG